MNNPLDYRSWGATANCKGCRYWSEMLASSTNGALQAVCIAPNGQFVGRFTTANQTCGEWLEGSLGAVDSPAGDPYAEAQP